MNVRLSNAIRTLRIGGFIVAFHSVDPAPNGARATLRMRFGGLLGGVMGRKMADLNHRYLAMDIAGLKCASEDGIRAPTLPLDQWHAEAMRRILPRSLAWRRQVAIAD